MGTQEYTLEVDDIQGIIVRGYSKLEAACFVFLKITDAGKAKHWLANMANKIEDGTSNPADSCMNVAFTFEGLKALGLNSYTLSLFSNEFQEGMTCEYRSRILGDHGESAPDKWQWGGPKSEPIHILLMHYASDEETLQAFYANSSDAFKNDGLTQVGPKLETLSLNGKEHFGFADGISQPIIAGLSKTGAEENTLRAGEFILGYPNEYGQYTVSPMVKSADDSKEILHGDINGSEDHDFGRNGSYLVFRQLHQNVQEFWQFMDHETRNPDNSVNPDERIKLASKMVGRWPSGAPLVLSEDHDRPELGKENDFSYHNTDPQGLKCPVSSHVRRTNPRGSLPPNPGSKGAIAIAKRHRLLRRGRSYGKPVDPSLAPEAMLGSSDRNTERGLHFICFNGNIRRQFEFIQQTWVNNRNFAGLYTDPDPIIGDCDTLKHGQPSTFTMPAHPVRKRVHNLPRFVDVRGGAYFFMPGIRAIKYLATNS
ncbi:Dyp-type peroxidase [Maribellus mangrovi]|uniref:Dyp-type peroxidase n=1 Tax=Maribellus mangrovi TaxID=3133146 RepID=UPI0030EE80D1